MVSLSLCRCGLLTPASGMSEQQLWMASSLLTTFLVAQDYLQWHYAGGDAQRSITSQTVPKHVSRVLSRHIWNIFQILFHKRWSLTPDPEFPRF